MNGQLLFFDALGLLLVIASLQVVVCQQPIRSAFYLIGCFAVSAMMWLMMNAEFLGLALIFVYVGAVMTLFLFVVMMINQDRLPAPISWKPLLAYVIWIVLLVGLIFFLRSYVFKGVQPVWTGSAPYLKSGHFPGYETKQLAQSLYTKYAIAFQTAGLLLLSAIVASVALVFFGVRSGVKTQSVADQLARGKRENVTLHRSVTKKRGKPQ